MRFKAIQGSGSLVMTGRQLTEPTKRLGSIGFPTLDVTMVKIPTIHGVKLDSIEDITK